jgi:hypothetical protein
MFPTRFGCSSASSSLVSSVFFQGVDFSHEAVLEARRRAFKGGPNKKPIGGKFANFLEGDLTQDSSYNMALRKVFEFIYTRFECSFHIFSTRFECSFHIFSTRFECSFHIFFTRLECSFHIFSTRFEFLFSKLRDVTLSRDSLFDVVSLQLAWHYISRDSSSARALLRRVSGLLRPGEMEFLHSFRVCFVHFLHSFRV